MAYGEGADPRNADLKAATVVYGPGKIMTMDGTNNRLDLSAATEIGLGISVGDSSRDSAKVLETTGATVSYYPLGGVLMVQALNGETYTTGCTVYVGANGLATVTAGSNKKLGLYVGEGIAATAALGANGAGDTTNTEGEMVPVMTAGAAIA
tara:strand:- start:5546 stop:6001 length:456 start_codon:yes stop_codon:yes gene_type:complete